MEKKMYQSDNFKESRWSGGSTTELAIYPEAADYIARNFIWRLSTADSNADESSFTRLENFDRVLMVLEGEVILAHGDERTVSLKAGEQDSFDGSVKTKCFGKLERDYNLIVRKGSKCRMELIELSGEGKALSLSDRRPADGDSIGGECVSYGIFSLEGYTVVSAGDSSEIVRQNQQMIITCQPDEKTCITLMGEGKCIFTEIIFEKEYSFSVDSSAESHRENNFLLALRLSLGNNRWNNILKRARKRGIFYAPEMEKKLRLLDKFMVGPVIWVIGLIACLGSMAFGASSSAVIAAIVTFTILDILIINPVIYILVLPKPIAAYVKRSSELTDYERRLFEEQINFDPRHERIMYKYRDRSKEEYSGMKDFISRLNK